MAIAQGAQLAHILHADRLAARHVDRAGQADVRNVGGALLLDERLHLAQVHIALERVQIGWVMGLVNDHIYEYAASHLLVQAGRGEVHVARDILPWLDRGLAQQMLRAASLVGWHDVAIAIVGLNGIFQVVEIAAAGIGFVAQHHASPLPIAHGARAAVGQQVNVDRLRAQEKRIVAGFGQRLLPLRAAHHAQRLDHLDLPRFRPRAATKLLAHRLWG